MLDAGVRVVFTVRLKVRSMPVLMAWACPHVVYMASKKRNQKAVSDSGSEFTDIQSLSEHTKKESSVTLQIYANYFMIVLTWLILQVADFVGVLYERYYQ
jgi:hypothetical protein